MSDENIIVNGNGTIFLGGPPLVKAATGEIVSAQDLGGAKVHCYTSGLTDHYCNDEVEALSKARSIIANINTKQYQFKEYEDPLFEQTELDYLLSSDLRKPVDCRNLIARVVDGSKFMEFKKGYGSTLVTGFGKLFGNEVGIVANNGILFSESAQKGAHFVTLCD